MPGPSLATTMTRIANPRLLSSVVYYEVASNIWQDLPEVGQGVQDVVGEQSAAAAAAASVRRSVVTVEHGSHVGLAEGLL